MNYNEFKPMLACSVFDSEDTLFDDETLLQKLQTLKYPVYATIKLDGRRAFRLNKSLLSRSLKVIQNKELVAKAVELVAPGADVELYNPSMTLYEIMSITSSFEHPLTNRIQFHILDGVFDGNWMDRLDKIYYWYNNFNIPLSVKFPVYVRCENAEQLLNCFKRNEAEGEEGICFRLLHENYKFGRSTLNEQGLMKLVRWHFGIAYVTDFEEEMENFNKGKRNALGYLERSSENWGLKGKNSLGALVCCDMSTGITFKIGTGFSAKDRQEMWDSRSLLVGKIVKYKYKGREKIRPRNPVFCNFC